MILSQESEFTSEGLGETFEYTARPEDMTHIFKILRSSLYSDKPLAVLREYASNAYEAHQEAGIPERPISIHLPSSLDPTLRIRDYGAGLTPGDIRNVYTSFGRSTKRSSNDFMGCLGFGSKAGFAYSSSFSVLSHVNGTCSHYEMFLDERDRSQCTKVLETPSKESGIEVRIPVRDTDIRTFLIVATRLFQFWKPTPEFTGGNIDQKSWSAPYMQGKGWELYGNTIPKVKMGQITYQIDTSQFLQYRTLLSEGLIIDVPIGSVTHTPSRESLEYTASTLGYLNKRIEEIYEEIKLIVAKKFDVCTSRYEAIQLSFQLSKNGSYLIKEILTNHTEWNNLSCSGVIDFDEDKAHKALGIKLQDVSRSGEKRYHFYSLNRYRGYEYYFKKSENTENISKRILRWIEDNNIANNRELVLLTLPDNKEEADAILASPYLDGFPWIDLDTIDIKKERISTQRVTGRILRYSHGGWIECDMPETPGFYLSTSGHTLNQGDLKYLPTPLSNIYTFIEDYVACPIYGIAVTKVPAGWKNIEAILPGKIQERFLAKSTDKLWDAGFDHTLYQEYNLFIKYKDKIEKDSPMYKFISRLEDSIPVVDIYMNAKALNCPIKLPKRSAVTMRQEYERLEQLYPLLWQMNLQQRLRQKFVDFINLCDAGRKYLAQKETP